MKTPKDNNEYTELQVLIARITVSIENIEKEIGDIKEGMIPNGRERIVNLEKDIKMLNKFKNGLAAIGALLIILLPFSDKLFR